MTDASETAELAYLWPPKTSPVHDSEKSSKQLQVKTREVMKRLDLKDDNIKKFILKCRSGWHPYPGSPRYGLNLK